MYRVQDPTNEQVHYRRAIARRRIAGTLLALASYHTGWRAFAAGYINGAEADAIAAHLEQCEPCFAIMVDCSGLSRSLFDE